MSLGLEIRETKIEDSSGKVVGSNLEVVRFHYDLPDGSIMLKSGFVFIGTNLEEDKEENKE